MDEVTPNKGVRQLTLVRVVSANLNFGCMRGIIEGTSVPVTISVFTHRHQRLRD